MPYNPDQHHRRSIRLPDYDYSQSGAYFVTICTHERQCNLSQVIDGEIHLTDFGKIVQEEWMNTATLRSSLELDIWVIMPNHFHAIVHIAGANDSPRSSRRGTARRAPTYATEEFGRPVAASLPTIVRSFKSAVTKRVNELRDTPGLPLWQRNYYEHVIRDEDDLARIREYIANNPANWPDDENHPARLTPPS